MATRVAPRASGFSSGAGSGAGSAAGSECADCTRFTGRVLSYDPTRGLGWVLDINNEAAQPVSVHFSEIRPAWPDDKLASRSALLQGEYVEYGVGPNPKNAARMCCKDVTGLGGGPLMMDHAVLRRVLRRSRDFDTRVAHEPDAAGSRRGRVTSYHARKGWGWIKDLDTDEAFFVHFSEIAYYWSTRLGADEEGVFKPCLFTGEYVQFNLGSNPYTSQTCAKRVTGPRCGPLLMDFGTYRYIRYRAQSSSHDASYGQPPPVGADPRIGQGSSSDEGPPSGLQAVDSAHPAGNDTTCGYDYGYGVAGTGYSGGYGYGEAGSDAGTGYSGGYGYGEAGSDAGSGACTSAGVVAGTYAGTDAGIYEGSCTDR